MLCVAAAGCGIDAVGALVVGAPSDAAPPDAIATGARPDTSSASSDAGDDAPSAGGDVAVTDAVADIAVDVNVDAGPCALCPKGTARMMCVANACVATRRVFVSSTGSTANLGGVAGADGRCQTLANAAQLGGMWRAWVSASGNTPVTRFTQATVPYRLLDGTVVADDWADLTNGNVDHGIDRNENNAFVSAAEVWTATTTGGNFAGGGCNGFTSGANGSPFAAQGITDRSDGDWTDVYDQFCDRTEPRIYCFEQ